ncbi:response regulator [Oscillochloris sp. ZM17-4]|uniref:response regulator n=1 Tax=Oscillochloris sp. ZM17-4 TaxID=2866714 RepID=UPI001C736A60|nr:response regulator [Oscillochloris sp. ZM17-4]MBX0327270.1 response regulator [Oscillochloris sp. ZM17-4]
MAHETILIVEDDSAISRLLEVYLSNKGYQVRTASRGEEALAICRATPPDLILLDVRLPDISGYDVGMALRATPDTQNIPIVVLTAFTERNDRMIAHHTVRADYFLGKPFDIEEVYWVVRNQLDEGRRRGQFHPVTNLPTGEQVNARLRELLATTGWTLALIRINGFESFTQFYGVMVGENVLKFTALLISDVVGRHGVSGDMVGQMVAGPYFVLITSTVPSGGIYQELADRFDADIPLHYDYHDRERGGLEVDGDDGQVRRFPLMSLSVGVLTSADGPFRDIRELTEVAEDLLQHAKAGGGERRSAIIYGK